MTTSVLSPRAAQASRIACIVGLSALPVLGWSPNPRVVDSGFAIMGAALLTLILPGLALGECARTRARHPLQVIADAFFYSLILALVCALAGFITGSSIGVVLLMMAVVSISALAVAAVRDRKGLVSTLPGAAISPAEGATWLGLLGLLALAMYRTADRLSTVGFELAVHLTYVRQYASGLPLDFQAATLRDTPSFFLPNLFFLWEFLLALISTTAQVDPIVAAMRSRWLVPVLGLACFYSFSRAITRSDRGARTLTLMMVLLCVSGFIFIEPGQFAGLPRAEGRGIMAFWGSIHHSDTAMEILLPLVLAKLLSAVERRSAPRLLALGFSVMASFFWHPRETFQVTWYAAMLVLTLGLLLALRRESRRRFWNSVAALAVVVAVAGATAFLCRIASPHVAEVTKQIDYKERIWNDPVAAGALKFSNPLAPAPHGLADQAVPVTFAYGFLAAAVLFLPGVVLTSRSSRRFTLFFIVVWILTLCAGPVQWLLLLTTYSEILNSVIRFIFILAYPAFFLGFLGVFGRIDTALKDVRHRTPLLLLSALGVGALFRLAWAMDQPAFGALLLAGPLWLGLWTPSLAWARTRRANRLSPILAAVLFALFLVPNVSRAASPLSAFADRPPLAQFSDSNEMEIPSGVVGALRRLPPRTHVMVEPRTPHILGAYAPLYVYPFAAGSIIEDYEAVGAANRNAVFGDGPRRGVFDCAAVRRLLRQNHIDYIVGARASVPVLDRLQEACPLVVGRFFETQKRDGVILAVASRLTAEYGK